MIPLEFVYGLLVGLAVAVGLYVVLVWLARRSVSTAEPPGGAVWSGLPEDDGPVLPAAIAAAPASRDLLSASVDASGTAVEVAALSSSSDPVSRPVPAAIGRAPLGRSVPATETLRLSQRVILHVYALGNVPSGEVAPPGLCQAGIVEALGIPQAGLAAVLRRLEAAAILTTERGHVRGHDRRLKVYRLSSRGLEIARELRTRAHRRPVEPRA